ncbi:hypothetical protein [Streptomyces sp. NBC_01451]|uniref:hypothetical protein n=1 Tax=Streptomyces sp. NBC_01451 TaxID=2903872 RepID=UPI002E344158|nr:hypothetical protein [Streptomyces sp. NBC_01451]
MTWTDAQGISRQLYESGAARLRYVAGRSGTGRYQMPPGEPVWNTKDVRAYQVLGLWEVTWLEEGDTEHTGAWRIDGLTDRGRELLAEWERRVESGGGRRGPKRTSTPRKA